MTEDTKLQISQPLASHFPKWERTISENWLGKVQSDLVMDIDCWCCFLVFIECSIPGKGQGKWVHSCGLQSKLCIFRSLWIRTSIQECQFSGKFYTIYRVCQPLSWSSSVICEVLALFEVWGYKIIGFFLVSTHTCTNLNSAVNQTSDCESCRLVSAVRAG